MKSTSFYMRIFHRYLGFFLVGIMAVYALSGIVLIFRDTEFLKKEVQIERTLEPNIPQSELGKALRRRNFKVLKEEGDIIFFNNGEYNKVTGFAKFTGKELPFVLKQMTKLHKANSKHPLFYLNIFFGVSLLFFVVSSFWMFLPKSSIFKKGIYYTIAGIILTVVLLFI
ncbi:hypothetical protein [Urechidicola croceus]|uniref:Peptidase n=1 Tax=Urechidicola croceus TaxID=1850246 RepID=A0A1D8PBX1_9FLAO|nr:hypothetical protein [Urechidicola croceus]AOW21995.1 hypothetical protein LPB138_03480 [Urechidicola croceus]